MTRPPLLSPPLRGRRIVAICLDTLGDLVLRQPMLSACVEAGADVTVVVRTAVAPLVLRFSAAVSTLTTDLHPYRFQLQQWREVVALAERIRATEPALVLFPTYARTQLETLLCALLPGLTTAGYAVADHDIDLARADARGAGVDIAEPRWTRQTAVERETREDLKHAQLLWDLCGLQIQERRPVLKPLAEDIAAAQSLLAGLGLKTGSFALVVPLGATSVPLKAIGMDVLRRACGVLRDRGLGILVVGTQDEERASREKFTDIPDVRFWFGAPDELGLLVGLIAASAAYFGADTGPMHMAAALDKPTAAVFGGGHWPRFLPAATRGFAVTNGLPCFGCEWRCVLATPECVHGVRGERIERLLAGLLDGAPGFVVEVGESGPRPMTGFEAALAASVRSEQERARLTADWAMRVERDLAAARSLEAENRSWALRTEELLRRERERADGAVEWARRSDALRERQSRECAELRRWAEEAEGRAAREKLRADAAERLAAERALENEQLIRERGGAVQAEVARLTKTTAEDTTVAAQHLADEHRRRAEQAEAQLAQALEELRVGAELKQQADAERSRLRNAVDELQVALLSTKGEQHDAQLLLAEARVRIAALEAEIAPLRRFAKAYRWIYSLHHGKR